jgi:hypothetical protein
METWNLEELNAEIWQQPLAEVAPIHVMSAYEIQG